MATLTHRSFLLVSTACTLGAEKALAEGDDGAGDRDARLLALCASHIATEKEILILSKSPEEERLEALCTKQGTVMREVVLTPAFTVVGVAAKLDLWRRTERTYLDDNDLLWDSLADDLSLLSGLAVAKFHPGTPTQELSAPPPYRIERRPAPSPNRAARCGHSVSDTAPDTTREEDGDSMAATSVP